MASHARADSIDAVAGRGGEAHGRAPAWRVGRPTTSGCATSALGKRPRATRSFRRRTTPSRWRAPSTCWDSVAEVGPNYTLLRSKETKAMRRIISGASVSFTCVLDLKLYLLRDAHEAC